MQLTAEASFISLAAVIVVFALIWVSPTFSVVPADFDKNHAEKCATL